MKIEIKTGHVEKAIRLYLSKKTGVTIDKIGFKDIDMNKLIRGRIFF